MYLHAGDVIHRIILYYILPRDSALDFESVRDIVTRLPLKDYAIVIQRDRCELALEFLAPYTINDPTILEIKGTGAKVYANDVPDIFEKIRDFGPPFGSYRYNTVSFLDLPKMHFPQPEKYEVRPSYETYRRFVTIATNSTSVEDFINQVQSEAPAYSEEYVDEVRDIAKKVHLFGSKITKTELSNMLKVLAYFRFE